MRARVGFVVAALLAGGCSTNPRNEIAPVAEAALAEVVRTAPGQALCVDRVIVPWQPSNEVRRIDPPVPPGYGVLMAAGVFRGGGGLKGAEVGGMAVRGDPACFDLRGPLIAGDRAMMEVHSAGLGAGTGWNAWLRRRGRDWYVETVTTSVYPG